MLSRKETLFCVGGLTMVASVVWTLRFDSQRKKLQPLPNAAGQGITLTQPKSIKPGTNSYVYGDFSLATVPDPNTSTATLIENRTKYTIGEKVKVLIQLRDSKRKNLSQGGDYLRIWLKDGTSNVNGDIIDHGNGSYTGSILLPWRGTPHIYVSIANVKQQIHHVMKTIEEHGLLFRINAKFINKQKKVAVTPCSPTLGVKGWKGICNLTSMNYDVAWYSEKPSDPSINCSDWKSMNYNGTITLPKAMYNWIRQHHHTILRTKIQIQVSGEKDVIQTNNEYCHQSKRELTWTNTSPAGFYRNGSWVNMMCKSSLGRTASDYNKCLKNRHLLLIGDSNSRSIISFLQSYLRLKTTTGFMLAGKPWQQFTYAFGIKTKVSVSWAVHETPFQSVYFFDKEIAKPPFVRLNEIGKGNNSIILVHMFSHFARAKPEVLRTEVKLMRRAYENLLIRSPDVVLVIKGPHAWTYNKIVDPLDYISRLHERIWFEEFKGLHHQVLYLDMWDITVGSQNVNSHPSHTTLSDMIHIFLSYVCNRK